MTEEKAKNIYDILNRAYPDAVCSLDWTTPFELLAATILAAQCTDERVNAVTKTLFEKYRTLEDYALCPPEEMEEAVKSTGFYRNKAKNIILCAEKLIKDFGGRVPDTMEDLLSLPGVGRKTANLILGEVYNIPSVIVDTHVKRISKKLGLTQHTDPEKIEYDLRECLPKECYTHFNHIIVFHGRAVCKAKGSLCDICPVCHLCDFYAHARGKNKC